MKRRSNKNIRINAEVQRELSHIIQYGLKDPRVTALTSVVKVDVAPDLKTCKAYISTLGEDNSLVETIKGLQSAEGFIRRELARTLNMRNTPEIKFIADSSIAYGVKMSKRIEELVGDIDDTEKTDDIDKNADRENSEEPGQE
ncbi:MAG: 30S ribosome-binding factor RbfA [Lachnospiraceae bacterium]|jgi:ribosome-binding factor A|nr:30S ribosome-binding factor RbfA [Lachnospiraceae bacterium]